MPAILVRSSKSVSWRLCIVFSDRNHAMKNLKIGVRLGGAFAAVLLLLTSLTVVGIVQMQSASKETDALVNVKVRNERLIGEWTKVIEVNAARTAAAWKVGDPEHQKQFEQEMAV